MSIVSAIRGLFAPPDHERQWRLVMSAFAEASVSGEITETVSLVRVPVGARLPDNSTREFFWRHPEGHPFQVYEGPLGGDCLPTEKPWAEWEEVWSNIPNLDGYDLKVDEYSDRAYLVWRGGH